MTRVTGRYERLDPAAVRATVDRLHGRIEARFPGRNLRRLHRLRSLAHVIDMHQLTKDPERLRPSFRPTTQTVDVDLDADDLAAYLDYCTELLSLVAKSAALCAEESTDSVVLDTVSTIESVTGGMQTKIWQKIATLDLPPVPPSPRRA